MKLNMKTSFHFKSKAKLLFAGLFVSLCLQATPQSYQSFFGGNTTKYHIYSRLICYIEDNDSVNTELLGSCGYTFDYTISKEDTAMINDTIYYKTQDYYGGGDKLLIREDTVNGQLFRYVEELNKEFLICDMSLNVGDTFTLPGDDYYYYREAGATTVVDSVAYINGKKVIYFSGIDGYMSNFGSYFYMKDDYYQQYFHLTFIEDVGPIYGPFGYVGGYGNEWYLGVLLCVEKDDTLAYITSPKLGCFQYGTSIKESEINPIRLYPNPVYDQLQIEFNEAIIADGVIRIIDPIGQIVYTKQINSSKETISVSHLFSGVYVVQYTTSDNKIFQSKFIKIK